MIAFGGPTISGRNFHPPLLLILERHKKQVLFLFFSFLVFFPLPPPDRGFEALSRHPPPPTFLGRTVMILSLLITPVLFFFLTQPGRKENVVDPPPTGSIVFLVLWCVCFSPPPLVFSSDPLFSVWHRLTFVFPMADPDLSLFHWHHRDQEPAFIPPPLPKPPLLFFSLAFVMDFASEVEGFLRSLFLSNIEMKFSPAQ